MYSVIVVSEQLGYWIKISNRMSMNGYGSKCKMGLMICMYRYVGRIAFTSLVGFVE